MNVNPVTILKDAVEKVPAARYALGVAGFAAAVAIVAGFQIDTRIAVFGTIICVALAFVLVVLSAAASHAGPSMAILALSAAWAFLVLTVATCFLLVTCYFFQWPRPLESFLPVDPIDPYRVVTQWIEVAKEHRRSGTVAFGRPLPSAVVKARGAFEAWWTETPLSAKAECPEGDIYEALRANYGIYRIQEIEDARKPSSFLWVDAGIRYFEETSNRKYLVESLLDKGGIYLELTDIEHTNPDGFRKVSEEGDAVLRRAVDLATGEQKSSALRIWSRFYYNLARPPKGRLDDAWDNNYLLTSYKKMLEALEADPSSKENITTYARVTQRAAGNPPLDRDPTWTGRLRDAQVRLKAYWDDQGHNLNDWRDKVSPLNVLGVLTFEVALREWQGLADADRKHQAPKFLQEIEDVALPAQREALTLVKGTHLEKEYDYDLAYDVARMHAGRLTMLDYVRSPLADDEARAVTENLALARMNASSQQVTEALNSLTTAPCFASLSTKRIAAFRVALGREN